MNIKPCPKMNALMEEHIATHMKECPECQAFVADIQRAFPIVKMIARALGVSFFTLTKGRDNGKGKEG